MQHGLNIVHKTQLKIWGRAQHEAAHRCQSDWKYNLWVLGRVNISGGSTPKDGNIVSRKKVHLGG